MMDRILPCISSCKDTREIGYADIIPSKIVRFNDDLILRNVKINSARLKNGNNCILHGQGKDDIFIIILVIRRQLWKFVKDNNLGVILDAPFDVVLSETDVLQPDILFVSRERMGQLTENNLRGAPDLII